MIGKYNGKGQVICWNKQTNKHFLHYKQLNTFDRSYHIHKYLDNLACKCAQAIRMLSDEYTSVHVSYLWFPGGCNICSRAAGLTSIMAQKVTRILAPWRLFESDSNNGPSLRHSNLVSDLNLHICSSLLLTISKWLTLKCAVTQWRSNAVVTKIRSDY